MRSDVPQVTEGVEGVRGASISEPNLIADLFQHRSRTAAENFGRTEFGLGINPAYPVF